MNERSHGESTSKQIGTVKGKNEETDHEGDFHNLNILVFKPEAFGRSINLELSRIIRPDMV